MIKRLYRYISFEDFVNLAVNNKDRFVRPCAWDDKYEGYLFSYMESQKDVRHIVSEMYYRFCPKNYYAIVDNYFKMWHSKWYTYAQCWSGHKETDAMWRCYSYENRAIRIRTREDKLLNHTKTIFSEMNNFKVDLKKVTYDLSKKSVVEQQIGQMNNSLSAYETYLHKRPAFKHEEEYRLLIVDGTLYSRDVLSAFAAKFNINIKGKTITDKSDEEIIDCLTDEICAVRKNKIKDEKKDADNVIIKDAGDISEYLEGVMVHPKAPMWYVDIIRDICQQKGISFDGQSQIYALK